MSLRAPPAFQEYAADLLAKEEIKLMSLASVHDRGCEASTSKKLWKKRGSMN